MKKLSIVLRFRSEYPTLLGTIYSFYEDAVASGLPFEIICVDNLSDDPAADVLEDKFRRWTRAGILKVVRYGEKASTWCAINAGYAVSTGDILVVADAHVSIKRGTLGLLAGGVIENGGLWHPSMHLWGDTEEIRNYGYDLRLTERFWGNPCRYLPPGRKVGDAWKIPMAGAYMYAVSRQEVERFGLYHPAFRAYGGGEPYLDLKWWLSGSAVWCHSGALVRHGFGTKATWKEDAKPRVHRNAVWTERGRATKTPDQGEKYLSYSAGYTAPSAFDFAFNFSLAAYLIGGDRWLRHVAEKLGCKQEEEICLAVHGETRQEMGVEDGALDALIVNPPWEFCAEHEQERGLA